MQANLHLVVPEMLLLFYASAIQFAALTTVSPVMGIKAKHTYIPLELAYTAYDAKFLTIF
jgi:hypothetical protein